VAFAGVVLGRMDSRTALTHTREEHLQHGRFSQIGRLAHLSCSDQRFELCAANDYCQDCL